MVKYGKLYREIQIKEFQGHYIDYKKLKQKIKQMRQILPRTSQEIITKQRNSNMPSIKMNFRGSFDDNYSRNESTLTTYDDKYGAQLKEFKDLLDQEFQCCYKYFKKIKKQLHVKINKHLYTQTNYASYNTEDIIKEVGNLRITMYLAKCLNAFINDNMMAIKKILKKFDKNFYNYFGNFGPKYILDNLFMSNSDLEYLLEFKIIDETSCIIESNVKLLRDNYLENIKSNGSNNTDNNNFYSKYSQILEYIKDIDELIYFKIQYKEWFYFRKKDNVSTKSNLYKNIMFNPILFSAFHKDDLMHKFLSRKEQIKEVEDMQIPMSFKNKINVILIFVQTFFYNTLISGIYPLLILFMRAKNLEKVENGEEIVNIKEVRYTFLIIASTYICSYFSIMFYYYFGNNRIKCAYIISYILFFIGSLLFILSYDKDLSIDETSQTKGYNKNYTLCLLVISRILVGLGANPTMGKNYILSYTPKFFLPIISKYYVLISILGHSFGPLITCAFFTKEDKYNTKIFPKFYYTKYNCFGWYGMIFSAFLMIINFIFFTSPNSKGFSKLKVKSSSSNKEKDLRETKFLSDDLEDTQDKEFYKLQKEMKNKHPLDLIEEDEKENDINSINSTKTKSKLSFKTKIENKSKININLCDDDYNVKRISTLENLNNSQMNQLNDNKYDVNPLIIKNNYKDEAYVDNDNDNENGNFVNVNMIPRIIDDLARKEKTKLSYLNRNLLIILTILFFDNLLKENFIAYCSYYVASNYKESKFKKIFEPRYFCCLISFSYSLEIVSLLFIFPLHKINTRIKKFLLLLMSLTIALMIPLSFKIDLLYYFILISIIILISSIIEVISSSYLAYLTPPDWKFSHINAGALPLFMMTFGKLCGCLICLTSFSDIILLNNHVVIIFTFLGYGISGFYMAKSKNFRVKAIARIMRKSELETNIY